MYLSLLTTIHDGHQQGAWFSLFSVSITGPSSAASSDLSPVAIFVVQFNSLQDTNLTNLPECTSVSSINTLLLCVALESQPLYIHVYIVNSLSSLSTLSRLPSASLRFTTQLKEMFCVRSSEIRAKVPDRRVNEIQSAACAHAHASWTRGPAGGQMDFPVNRTPPVKASENKSHRMYSAWALEGDQSLPRFFLLTFAGCRAAVDQNPA